MPHVLDNVYTATNAPTTGWSTQNVPSSPSAITLEWGPVTTAGTYYLRLELTVSITAVKIVLVSVKKNDQEIPYLKYADFLRENHGNYFYLASDASTNLTIGDGTSDAVDPIPIFKLASDARTDSPSTFVNTDLTNPVTAQNYVAGYYRIHYQGNENTGTYVSKFYTDDYFCPYPSGFHDVYGVFAGCTANPSVSGELINLHAQYVIQAHGCGVRQYFDGTCKNVD